MKTRLKKRIFERVLVPIVPGADQSSVINAARAIAGEENVILVGLVYIPVEESLSGAAREVQEVRQTLRRFSSMTHLHRWPVVYATHRPWEEIVRVVEKEQPDLLILEYPYQFETLKTTPTEVLTHPPCDIAIVNPYFPNTLNNILIAIRGGPYAELALRTVLSMKRLHQMDVRSLHVVPIDRTRKQDAAFRGIERVLKNLPEIKRQEIVTDNPGEVIFEALHKYDLIVLGASARPADEVSSFGQVATRLMSESERGVMVVKT
jgi:glucosyl-3-phosphoglycerate synthase